MIIKTYLIEDIQSCADWCVELGYQLIYDNTQVVPWWIADSEGNILWGNHTLEKAIWRLEQRFMNE